MLRRGVFPGHRSLLVTHVGRGCLPLTRVRGALWAAAVVMLASCRTVPTIHEPSATAWEQRRSQLQARDRFELKGRVAVAAGGEGFNARLRWTQDGKQTHMSLDG